jgi:RNA polymerase sigma-70 factor (ECF subfamily)
MYSQEIILEILNKDPERALPILYDKYSSAIYGIILRVVKCEKDAQDVMQEVFLKIWKNKNSYDPQKGRLFTWMMHIARNSSINFINSKAKKSRDNIHPIDSNVHHIKSNNKINIDSIDLIDIMGGLEDKYRQVIELAYFEGYTQKEISERLQLPLGSVKSCVKIGLRKLRSIYEGNIISTGIITMVIVMQSMVIV